MTEEICCGEGKKPRGAFAEDPVDPASDPLVGLLLGPRPFPSVEVLLFLRLCCLGFAAGVSAGPDAEVRAQRSTRGSQLQREADKRVGGRLMLQAGHVGVELPRFIGGILPLRLRPPGLKKLSNDRNNCQMTQAGPDSDAIK